MGDPVLEALGEVDTEDPVLKALGTPPEPAGATPPPQPDSPEVAGRKAANEGAERRRVAELRELALRRSGMRGSEFDALPPEKQKPYYDAALKGKEETRGPRPESALERIGRTVVQPGAKQAVKTVGEFVETPLIVADAAKEAMFGDLPRSKRILSREERPLQSLEGTRFYNAARFAEDPLTYMGTGLLGKGKPPVPTTATERATFNEGFQMEREGALNEARRLRESKQITRSMKTDEVERLAGEFGLRKPPQRIINPTAPPAKPPAIINPNIPETTKDRGLLKNFPARMGQGEAQVSADTRVMDAPLGTKVYMAGPNGFTEPVDIIGHRTDYKANVLLKNGEKKYGVPYNELRREEMLGSEAGIPPVKEPPSTPLTPPPNTPSATTAPAVTTTRPQGAPTVSPGGNPPLPELPKSAWTRGFDKVTGGMGSWLEEKAPAASDALRKLTAESKFADYSDDAGNLYETYIADKGRREGDVSDLLIPADRALRKAKPEPAAMGEFFKYASSRTAEVPEVIKQNPAIGEAVDYYNGVLRPQLVKAGYGSEESFGQFPRYLPNIVTAEMERAPLFRSKGPRAGRTMLRKNLDGVTMLGMNKSEAKDLAASLEATTGIKPAVVGPYGRSSYAKFASIEDRDAFIRALDAERTGAGTLGKKWAGKIKYETFDKIPDEWLEKAAKEGGGGLVTDPQALLASGMKQAADELSSREFFQNLTKFAKPVEPGQAAEAGWHLVPNTPKWGALAGTQVEEKLWNALSDFEPRQMSVIGEMWQGTLRAFKTNAIVKMATGARNAYYDAISLSVGNRLPPASPAWFKEIKAGISSHLDWWKTGKRPTVIREFQENGGILGGHSLESEGLQKMQTLFDRADPNGGKMPLSDFMEQFVHLSTGSPYALQKGEQGVLKRAGRAASGAAAGAGRAAAMGEGVGKIAGRAALGAAQNTAIGEVAKYGAELYQRTDDIFKIAWYRNWKNILAKEHPELTAEQIGRLAAKEVNDRSQIFSMRSPITEEVSRTGIVPFASWWDNKVRIETHLLRKDPHLFALMQSQGTMQKAAAATGLVLATGIPAAVMWDWVKKNPGMVPVSAYKDEKTKEWHIVGWRHQYVTPDPVAATQQMVKNPGEGVRDFAMQNPMIAGVTKGAALFAGGPKATDPTFLEGRPLLDKGEPVKAGYLRFWQHGLGSSIGPTGQQTEEAIKTATGDEFKSSVEKRSGIRTALDIGAGLKTSDQPVGASSDFAEFGYEKALSAANSWWNRATNDPDVKKLSLLNPERRRIDAEYDKMALAAYERAIENGARVPPPGLKTAEGLARLRGLATVPGGAGR
jgi:hypothetical protein